MTNNQKYNLFLDAVRIIRSLADVFEAIADTYRDATVAEADAKVIDAQEVKELPAEKEVTLESHSVPEFLPQILPSLLPQYWESLNNCSRLSVPVSYVLLFPQAA